MRTASKSVYFDVLDDIFNTYNNTFHRTINMKSIDVESDSYAEFNFDSNKKNPKFKVGDHFTISKNNFFLLRDMPQIGQKKFLLFAKLKKQFHGHMLLVI